MEVSIGALYFFTGSTFSDSDSVGNSGDSSHSIFGFLDFGDGDVGRVDGDLVRSSVNFILGDLIDVNSPFLSLDLDHFSLGAFAGTSEDDNFVVFADGQASNTVFTSEGF